MKVKKINLLLLTGLVLVFSPLAFGAFSPLALDLVAPVQLPPDDITITGVRLSVFYGDHRNVYGIDVAGIGNMTELNFVGLAVAGGFNITKGNTTIVGLQAAVGANVNSQKTKVFGVQLAAVNSNTAESSVVGFAIAPITNWGPHTTIYGIEAGIYNDALDVYGIQVGVVNRVKNLHGLQIGLLNFNEQGLFPVCPFLNIGF